MAAELKDTKKQAAAAASAPITDDGVDGTKQQQQQPSSSAAAPPAPPTKEGESNEGDSSLSAKENPFDQYYSQLTHQQNMLQDSARVTAYQRAILENAADFKVRFRSQQYIYCCCTPW